VPVGSEMNQVFASPLRKQVGTRAIYGFVVDLG
jgi:hypothetical protein